MGIRLILNRGRPRVLRDANAQPDPNQGASSLYEAARPRA